MEGKFDFQKMGLINLSYKESLEIEGGKWSWGKIWSVIGAGLALIVAIATL